MNFSPYQPPPDAPSSGSSSPTRGGSGGGKNKGKGKPWFSREGAASGGGYQSGAGVADNTAAAAAFGNDPEEALYGYGGSNGGYEAGPSSGDRYGYPSSSSANEERVNAWESRFGWRIDVMAAATYLGGPVTALIFLILETQNDYVRFHAYQSALLTTPLVIFILLTNLVIPLWSWLRTLIVLGGIGVTLYASFRAYKDAQEGLGRFWLPYIGEIAERYVNEE